MNKRKRTKAIIERRKNYPQGNQLLNDRSRWLLKEFSKNVTSQNGEDGIIEKIFEVLADNEVKNDKWCVEFGAWDGMHLSNTWSLINKKGWYSVQIEGDEEKYTELSTRYHTNDKVICLCSLVEFDGENSLDNILQTTPIPREFDMICIDIDGADYHIWDSLKNYQPKLVVIEFNPTIPNHVLFIQEKKMSVHQGSSLLALIELGKSKGYELVSCTLFNAFFVKSKYFEMFNIKDNSPNLLHFPTMDTDLFQLYDGTLMITGCKKLLWHKLPITHKALQVLPPAKRYFPFAPPRLDQVNEAESICRSLLKEKKNVKSKFDTLLDLSKELISNSATEAEGIKILIGITDALDALNVDANSKAFVNKEIISILEMKGDKEWHAGHPKVAVHWYKKVLFFIQVLEDQSSMAEVYYQSAIKIAKSHLSLKAIDSCFFWVNYARNVQCPEQDSSELDRIWLKLTKLSRETSCFCSVKTGLGNQSGVKKLVQDARQYQSKSDGVNTQLPSMSFCHLGNQRQQKLLNLKRLSNLFAWTALLSSAATVVTSALLLSKK